MGPMAALSAPVPETGLGPVHRPVILTNPEPVELPVPATQNRLSCLSCPDSSSFAPPALCTLSEQSGKRAGCLAGLSCFERCCSVWPALSCLAEE